MFDRFIRLSKASRALRDERFEDALQAALDPVIAGERRAEDIRRQAADRLLARARQRLAVGDLAAAQAIEERVRAALGAAATDEIRAAIADAQQRAQALAADLRQRRGDVQAAIATGELAAAEERLRTPPLLPADERAALQAAIDGRRQQAGEAAALALAALAEGQLEAALEHLQRAAALDAQHPQVAVARRRCTTEGSQVAAAALDAHIAAADLPAALARYRAYCSSLPDLALAGPLRAAAARLAECVLAALRAPGPLPVAIGLARAAAAAGLPLPAPTGALVAALAAVPAGDDLPSAATALAALREAAAAAGAEEVASAAAARLRAATAAEERLAAARRLVAAGDLDAARGVLAALVAEQPMWESARAELELLDQGVAGLDQQLAEARAALRAGRLRAACAQALALAGTARHAAEAQQVLVEARGRLALVQRGLDEIRVALHGRASATAEGVRHCLRRLEELAKVQTDHPELPGVIAAVQAELHALGLCDRIGAALERRALPEAVQGLAEIAALRPRLLAEDRLDARICDLADRLARVAETLLAAGRLRDVELCAVQSEALGGVRAEFAARAAAWRAGAAGRRDAAVRICEAAQARLAARDLAEAERLHEEALRQWAECPEARRLGNELRLLRQQAATLERARELAHERDFVGAHERLAAMPPASPLLRTRIYDMKRDLARAQGLDGAFLLRVDEGGEHLVLRGESVSIGNVRQLRADVPVLANLAGRHASIRRSMSFHGGMQDTVVAEEGEVRIGGARIDQRVLRDGDRVQLGPALGLVYQRPTSRSLTVRLQLTGGFQVAGTDRILLLKDRGRDGRILLGPGDDVHVRVPRADGEVEVFANGSGQLRVACSRGGAIDGVPFAGEHPLAAGQFVEAAGIAFQLLPWRPGA